MKKSDGENVVVFWFRRDLRHKDNHGLLKALQSGQIAGAGLDVYVNEPHVDPRLLDLPNTVLLPHMGSATYEGRAAMGEKVIANIRAWVDGHRPPDQVLEGWD